MLADEASNRVATTVPTQVGATPSQAVDEVLQSSAGVIGWLFADVKAWDYFDPPLPPVMIDSVGSSSSIAHEVAQGEGRGRHRLSDNTVRFVIGEENAKVLDALDAMDSVAAQVRAHAECHVMTTDNGIRSA